MCSNNPLYNKYAKRNIVAFVILLVICAFFCFNCTTKNDMSIAFAEDGQTGEVEQELSNQVHEIFENLDLAELEEYFQDQAEYFESAFGITSFKDFLSAIINGEILTDFNSVFVAILGSVKRNLTQILSPIVLIIIIILLSVLFKSLRPKLTDGSVGQAIFFVSYSLIITIVSYLFASVYSKTTITISNMQNHTQATFPLILFLMTTSGGIASIKAYQPMVLFLSNAVSNIFSTILLPIVTVVFVIGIVGNLSTKAKLNKLTDFFYSTFKWIIGITFTVYMAFMAIQGITAGMADGVRIKTAKYAIKNYVPMLGGYISEGFEVARVGALVIKNALGFSGIILLFINLLTPILLIATIQLAFKLVSGLVEPISDSQTTAIFGATSKSLNMLLVTLIGVFMMYFVSLMLMICSMSGVSL